ncbi:hypothetical protein [Acaryochloris marina]|nr:hypothetical protein [Acaryochloris marina]
MRKLLLRQVYQKQVHRHQQAIARRTNIQSHYVGKSTGSQCSE